MVWYGKENLDNMNNTSILDVTNKYLKLKDLMHSFVDAL